MAERNGKGGNVAVLNRPLTEDVDAVNDADSGATGTEAGETGEGQGTDSGEAQGSAEGATAATATKAPKRNLDDAPDDEIVGITIRVPNGFRKLLAKSAMEQKPSTSVPQMLAQMAAEAFEYKLPEPERAPRIKKYDTPEERKQAQKHDQARQRLLARKTLEAVEKGVINVDVQALLAEVDAELAAKAEKEAAEKSVTGGDETATNTEPATAGAAS